MQLGKPELSAKYEEALSQAGPDATLDSVLRDMAGGANPLIEVADYETSGKEKLMILGITEAKLQRCATSLALSHSICSVLLGYLPAAHYFIHQNEVRSS